MPVMGPYEPRYGDTIAQLLARSGDPIARAAEAKAAAWGGALQSVGQIAAETVRARAEKKDAETRSRGISTALASWDGKDVGGLYRGLAPFAGTQDAMRLVGSVVAFQELGMKQDGQDQKRLGVALGAAELLPDDALAVQYPALREKAAALGVPVEQFPEQYTPELKPSLVRMGQMLRGETPKGPENPEPVTIGGKVTLATPSEIQAAKARGLEVTPYTAPKEERPDSRSVEARYADAVARGDTAGAQAMLEAQAKLQAAGRAPKSDEPKPLTATSESNIINRLSNQWSAAVKSTAEISRQVSLMEKGLEAARRGDMAAGSQAVLVTFQKILDPTSVVRESEYARSAAGQALLARITGAAEQLAKGGAGVPIAELEKFAKLAREMASGQTGYTKAVKERIGKVADRYQIPRELVVEDFDFSGEEKVKPEADKPWDATMAGGQIKIRVKR